MSAFADIGYEQALQYLAAYVALLYFDELTEHGVMVDESGERVAMKVQQLAIDAIELANQRIAEKAEKLLATQKPKAKA